MRPPGAAEGATPRRIVPTKVEAVHVDQSFLVAPTLTPESVQPAQLPPRTPTSTTAGGGASRSSFLLEEFGQPAPRCQLSFDATPSKGRVVANARQEAEVAALPLEELPDGLEQCLRRVHLGSPTPSSLLGSSCGGSLAAAPGSQARGASAGRGGTTASLGADPSPMERLEHRLSQRLTPAPLAPEQPERGSNGPLQPTVPAPPRQQLTAAASSAGASLPSPPAGEQVPLRNVHAAAVEVSSCCQRTAAAFLPPLP